jgi:hypothetical protein
MFIRPINYYKLLGLNGVQLDKRLSKDELMSMRTTLTNYLKRYFFNAGYFCIQRRWAYDFKQTNVFIIRPHPDFVDEQIEHSTLAFKCILNSNSQLEILESESVSGPVNEEVEQCFRGMLGETGNFCLAETDREGLEFLSSLPEVGADLAVPLKSWQTYLNWRQKLAEKKANEFYAYKNFRAFRGGRHVEFSLKHPAVLEMIKGRLVGESIRVHTEVQEVSPDCSDNEESNKKPPMAVFEGLFRNIKSPHQAHNVRGKGNYQLRKKGTPRGTPEELIITIIQDDDEGRPRYSAKDIPNKGFLRAAMEGELSAVEIQRKGLKRLVEHRGLNPNVRNWLFDIKQALPVSSDSELSWVPDQEDLNDEQRECVTKSLLCEDLLMLWGPPGTGKTTVIAEIASQYCRAGRQVLISSQANLAVDQALEKLPMLPHIRPARISTSKSARGIDIRQYMLRWLQSIAKQTSETLDEEADEVWHGLKKDWLNQLKKTQLTDLSEPCTRHYQKHVNVIGATCLETGKPDFISSSQFCSRFDLSIVDEVSKATPPELLLPALVGKRTLLVGDHRQLPPVFGESTFPEAVENGELEEVEFETFRNMVTTSMFEHFYEQGDESIKCGLSQQYRMHPQIMNAVNQFYADKPLQAGLGIETLSGLKAHDLSLLTPTGTSWLSADQHMVWIDSSRYATGAPAFDEKIGTSRQNMAEAELCVHLLKSLLPQNQSIGLISLYRAQIQNITRLLKEEVADPLVKRFLDDKSVNTVDQFQGSERDVIIVSLTRTDNKLTGEFIKDFRRINVAMSRARKLLIIIGRGETFDSGMVEVPSEEIGRTESRPSYKDIRQLAHADGAYKRLQGVFAGNPNAKEERKQNQPQKKNVQHRKKHPKQAKKQSPNPKNRNRNHRDRGDDLGNLSDAFSGVKI